MRILSLLGSPRANGTTHSMARLIAGGLSGGGPVEEIALQEKHIRPCRGCQSCDAAPHVCPLARTDDAEAVFAAIAAADVVLWTSPVYFYGLPAQAKALVDRSQRIWAGVEAGRPAGKGPLVLAAYPDKILNIHPSLIPSFCGAGYYGLHVHEKALDYGVKVTGATVHFVNEEPDGGPIVLQKAVDIREDDTPETLQRRVMEQCEWSILPRAVSLFCEGRLHVEGRHVKITEGAVCQ